jgi:magnesium transporter
MPGVIVESAVYRDGQRAGGSVPLQEALDEARAAGADGHGFAWIGLFEPSQDELAAVAAEFDLHPLAVEDAVNAHQRAKLEEYGDTVFLVLKTLAYDEGVESVHAGEVMLFAGRGFVVSVRHGPDAGLGDLRRQVESRPEQLCLGPSGVLHAVADLVVDRYEEALARLDEAVQQVEDEVFDEDRGHDLSERIYTLKRHVVAFRRAATPLREPVERLAGPGQPDVSAEVRPFFRDVADHLARVVDHLEALDSLLDGVLDANIAQVSVRMNADQRKISAWAAIGLVPTAIAGVYGMNFEHMPELTWRLGYPMALLLMVTVCSLLYRGFRRNGWL